jgi:hypothetical protein
MENPTTLAGWLNVLKLEGRLLSFRATKEDLFSLNKQHFLFGLLCTWAVGIGRYWDNSRAGLLQHLGIGSLVYVFILSLFLWLMVWPLRPKGWSYFRVLTFITLVSPPAILYAIPVQTWDIDAANAYNSWFLFVVSAWRVALLVLFLRRLGELDSLSTIVGAFFPLSIIVVGLTVLNLEHVTVSFMGGLVDRTPNDSAFGIVVLLSLFSFVLFIPLGVCYVAMAVLNRSQAREERTKQEAIREQNVQH